MTKILLPSSYVELTGDVQQCLLLAKEQGFSIDSIELGVSPTQLIQLVQGQQITSISTDLNVEERASDLADYVFVYRSNILVEHYLQQTRNAIFIGIQDVDSTQRDRDYSQFDIWRHPLTNEVRALSVRLDSCANTAPEYHLCWVLTLLALDFPLEDSLTLARAMQASAKSVSRETLSSRAWRIVDAWPAKYSDFPTPVLEDDRIGIKVGWHAGRDLSPFETLSESSLGLYPVVDDVDWIERLLPMGVTTIQLRIKNPDQDDLEQQIKKAIDLGRQHNAQVFINDYWQLAIKHGAFGVHLGQEDIEQSNLSQLNQAGICLGLSTHGYYELLRIVQISPSYIALGHIFPTTTKQMPSQPQGLVRLALYQKLIDSIPYGDRTGVPTVAIGGIDQSNADEVWQCGVTSLAVVRAITLAKSPQQVIEFFNQLMGSNLIGATEHKEVIEHA